MSNKVLFELSISLNGIPLAGPVYTENHESFTFVNKLNVHDVYVEIKKGVSGKWYKSGGPSYDFPEEFIQEIGSAIDSFSSK